MTLFVNVAILSFIPKVIKKRVDGAQPGATYASSHHGRPGVVRGAADYDRTMQLNYFDCLRVSMGLLPGIVARRQGHGVNISSIGVADQRAAFFSLSGQ